MAGAVNTDAMSHARQLLLHRDFEGWAGKGEFSYPTPPSYMTVEEAREIIVENIKSELAMERDREAGLAGVSGREGGNGEERASGGEKDGDAERNFEEDKGAGEERDGKEKREML